MATRDCNDAVGLVSTLTVTITTTVTDTGIGITDATSRTSATLRDITDSTGITDSISRSGAASRSVTDSVGITDPSIIVAVPTEPVPVDDTVTIREALTVTLSCTVTENGLGVTDSTAISGIGNNYSRTVTDAIGIVDSGTTASTTDALSSTVGLTDSASTGTSAQITATAIGAGSISALTSVRVIASTNGVGTALADNTATPTLMATVVRGYTFSEMHIQQDPFQNFIPSLVPSKTAKFSVEPWRVIDGIPNKDSRYSVRVDSAAEIGTHSTSSAYVAPASASIPAEYRWLAEDFALPEWYPNELVGTADVRSWDILRNEFTWFTMSRLTWQQAMEDTSDPAVPLWVSIGDPDPSLVADYVYWRAGEYITNPAVITDLGAAMTLDWAPTIVPEQMTVAMVFVPRVPSTGQYEVLSASNDIRVVLNADSTMDLWYGNQVLTTTAVGARSRPNEPIAIALSVSPLDRRVIMSVMDSYVRTVSSVIPSGVSISSLTWQIAKEGASVFEILEVDMFLRRMAQQEVADTISMFDRIYGVTAT